ncbi:MAG: sulfoxide reductase heme-binding subunit YedZ [Edaphobacter sp.]|uniref:sulfite oxidase heme-binding subunit YedZ n=1 Tax=Edaphobacter sp. TaxID=1934404 RepID=UPI0023A3429B|nr:protein-methionine-sulfoxide reductase heme-binding subunit MsrQ [Edaphobacter sp.]MDE1175215.1 sulfoxide reductase heme-binding subunit YedZ [Edaphobacter sp.]
MQKQTIILLKAVTHILCLLPLLSLYRFYSSGALALNSDPINFITHFTGNWALWILLASLAITPIRRISVRISWLIRFRRLIGLYAFFYATLHLATYLFLFSGYDVVAVLDGLRAGHPAVIFEQFRQVWPYIWDDVMKRRFVQVGFLAWLILLALAATSPAAIMRAMGGKNWQRLHRFVYLAAAAAVIHYWWLVKTGVLSPWKDTAILAVLLLARVGYVLLKKRSVSTTKVVAAR